MTAEEEITASVNGDGSSTVRQADGSTMHGGSVDGNNPSRPSGSEAENVSGNMKSDMNEAENMASVFSKKRSRLRN